jgi:hypothetical protein
MVRNDADGAGGVEAGFRHRRVSKIWRYTEATLRETLERVVAYYGAIPAIQEYDAWRAARAPLGDR